MPKTQRNTLTEDRSFELYQAFMAGYVRRINDATFKVSIGGVRIGTAKYSRLAQINLRSRIITFSRYAITDVPERGRRYLVLHELAHVKEASHNSRFWNLVSRFEPNYREVGKSLEQAFKKNVLAKPPDQSPIKLPNSFTGAYQLDEPLKITDNLKQKSAFIEDNESLASVQVPYQVQLPNNIEPLLSDETFDCLEQDFNEILEEEQSLANDTTNSDLYLDHLIYMH